MASLDLQNNKQVPSAVTDSPLRILVIGAHPDDAELHVGGIMALYRRLGHAVKIISVTDGAAGHHALLPDELRKVRAGELAGSAAVIGAAHECLGFPDGALTTSIEARLAIIRAIRKFTPDLLITHRTNDYHPDHRTVAQLIQDASYMVKVPLVAPDVPALRKDPVVMFMADFFTRPNPFRADVVVDVSNALDDVVRMVDNHVSQVYEWIPYVEGYAAEVPPADDAEARRAWLRGWLSRRPRALAKRHRDELIARYGQRGSNVEYAEALEESEYATRLTSDLRSRLFAGM